MSETMELSDLSEESKLRIEKSVAEAEIMLNERWEEYRTLQRKEQIASIKADDPAGHWHEWGGRLLSKQVSLYSDAGGHCLLGIAVEAHRELPGSYLALVREKGIPFVTERLRVPKSIEAEVTHQLIHVIRKYKLTDITNELIKRGAVTEAQKQKYNREEAARKLELSKRQIDRRVAKGTLVTEGVGSSKRITGASIENALRGRQQGSQKKKDIKRHKETFWLFIGRRRLPTLKV